MIGIKGISFKKNNETLNISIGAESKMYYRDILLLIDNNIIFKYLENLLSIIDSWQNEYIDTEIIDGDSWKLSIIYDDESKKEYFGKACFPYNFEALERLNQKLIGEVLNG